jgi:predicted permease
VAAAVLLASGAGLLARSVSKLYAIGPGVDTTHVAVVDIVMPESFSLAEKRATLHDLVADLSTIPGVTAAASTERLPLRGSGDTSGLSIPGAPADARPTTNFRLVSPGYFRAMGIPLRQGRALDPTPADAADASAERQVVVNEAFVKAFFPDREPIGQLIGGMNRPDRIVGVVGDVAEQRLTEKRPPARYYLADDLDWLAEGQTLVLRTAPSVDPGSLLAEARRLISKARPNVAIRELGTMQRVLDRAIGPAREVMTLLSLLSGLGLVLGAVGVYGVLSQFVARRAREWSIRTALGLTPWQLIRQVLRHGSALVGSGIVAGTLGALVFARLLSSLLYGVAATDPLALTGAAMALLAVGLLATLIPALRASRANPALVLRSE